MTSPTFSVVLIARNEEKTLPRLMSSLIEFRDRGGEIILVDTGSTDKTVEVAKSFGVSVFEEGDRFRREITQEEDIKARALVDVRESAVIQAGDTLFDFSAARNYAASLAKNDMVAMPDCDEVYTKLDIDSIEVAIKEGAEQLEYNFVFSHDAEGNELIKFIHSKFYDRRKLHWTGIIHEVLTGVATRKSLPENIIKLEHWQNHETNRGGYLKGLTLAVLDEPDNDRNAHYFARELLYAGRPYSAIGAFQRHIAMGKWPEERSQSYVHLGDTYLMVGARDQAIASFAQAFDVCPARREPLMRLAELYYREGNAPAAIAYAGAALQVKGASFYANFQPYYENIPHEILYWALWQIGDVRQSKFHFDRCLAYQPFNQKYLSDMFWYYEMPKLSFIVPHIPGTRTNGLKNLLASIAYLVWPEDKKEIIVLEDEPRIGVPKRVKEGVEKATGEWIVYCADDMVFDKYCILNAFKTAMDNKKSYVSFNEGPLLPDNGNIGTHFMIKKTLIAKIGGEIFDTEFHHVGVDNLLWAKVDDLQEGMWCKRAVIHHNHFSTNGREMDSVNKLAWNEENVKHDRELLKKKLSEIGRTS